MAAATDDTSKGPPKDPLADRLSHGHVVYSKSWKSDLWLYLKNNHVFISIFLAHPRHIYTAIERRIVLLISLMLAAGLALFFGLMEILNPTSTTTVWVLNLVVGGGLQGIYDTLLGVSAKCGCVQDMNKYIRCCCESIGRCAICVQFLFSFALFVAFLATFNDALGKMKDSVSKCAETDESCAARGEEYTEAQVLVPLQFIAGKMKGWVLDSIVLASLQFWWARRSQLKPKARC